MDSTGATPHATRHSRSSSNNGRPAGNGWSQRERAWTHDGGFLSIDHTSSPTPSVPQELTRHEWSSPEIEPRRGVDTEFIRTGEDLQEDSDDEMSPSSTPAASPPRASTSGSPDRSRRSRYLREVDRRAIIQRIANGERQAELAREYGVTRAAICHINKNRAEILARSTRPDVHAAARHPKRRMSMAALFQRQQRSREQHNHRHHPQQRQEQQHQLEELNGVSESEVVPSYVYKVRSRALALHMATLRRRDTSSSAFRSLANRAIWILLEEALAAAPTRSVDVVALDESVMPGLAHTNPACAMVLGESGYPMLEVFRALQPDSPTGSITLAPSSGNHDNLDDREPVLRKMCAPLQLRGHDVFLLDAVCKRAREMCVAIQSLLDFGVLERSVFVATLSISEAAAAEIHARFPQVRLVAAAVDAADVAACGLGLGGVDFLERYFNTNTIHSSALGADADV